MSAALNGTGISGQIDREYLRSVLIRYLEYMATGEEKEAMTLERVLFTVLDLKKADLKRLQEVRGQSLKSGLFGYFYSG